MEVIHKLKKEIRNYKVHYWYHTLPKASNFFMGKDQDVLVRRHVNYLGPHHGESIEPFRK